MICSQIVSTKIKRLIGVKMGFMLMFLPSYAGFQRQPQVHIWSMFRWFCFSVFDTVTMGGLFCVQLNFSLTCTSGDFYRLCWFFIRKFNLHIWFRFRWFYAGVCDAACSFLCGFVEYAACTCVVGLRFRVEVFNFNVYVRPSLKSVCASVFDRVCFNGDLKISIRIWRICSGDLFSCPVCSGWTMMWTTVEILHFEAYIRPRLRLVCASVFDRLCFHW